MLIVLVVLPFSPVTSLSDGIAERTLFNDSLPSVDVCHWNLIGLHKRTWRFEILMLASIPFEIDSAKAYLEPVLGSLASACRMHAAFFFFSENSAKRLPWNFRYFLFLPFLWADFCQPADAINASLHFYARLLYRGNEAELVWLLQCRCNCRNDHRNNGPARIQ